MTTTLFKIGLAAAAILAIISAVIVKAQPANTGHKTMRLWQGDAPGALGAKDGDIPTITLYTPKEGTANGAAFVVCPGGGYGGLADHEKAPIAEWLAAHGVTAVTLKYRLGPRYHHPVELGDAQRAIRTVRFNAKEWNIDPNRVGILGFSAGGHLASTAATHFDDGDPNAADPVDRFSSHPDLAVLVYPVITFSGPYSHAGTRANLLGDNPAPELLTLLSNEKQVTKRTPPTFLVHTVQDSVVPVENSFLFASALRKAGVPFELHVFETGEHGYGLGGSDPVLSAWPDMCIHWMRKRGFFSGKGR